MRFARSGFCTSTASYAAYQVARLGKAGVERVIMACAAGQGEMFEEELAGLGPEVVASEEPACFGRGGGIKFAARSRAESAVTSLR